MGLFDPKDLELQELSPASSPALVTEARELLLEYGRFVLAQPGGARFCFGSLEGEAARLPNTYLEQGGGCFVARVGHEPAGFIAWRRLPSDTVPDASEMKRLWVRPIARGLGLGRLLTQTVIDRVEQAGQSAVYLDTVPESMDSAYRMYIAMGFTPCAKYNDNPMEEIVYMVKRL